MEKYLKQYKKLQKPYKVTIIFIGISTILLLTLIIFVIFPLLNISANETSAVSSSKEIDKIILVNGILSGAIIISSFTALVSALIGKKHDKRKSKK